MMHPTAPPFSPFPEPVRRRHQDPSGLWSRVWSGSVVLHILLLLAVLPSLKTAAERARGAGAATPIELVDVGAIAPDTTLDPATAPAAPPATEAPIPAPSPATLPAIPPAVSPVPNPPAPAAANPPAVFAPAPPTLTPSPTPSLPLPTPIPSTPPPIPPSPSPAALPQPSPATPPPPQPPLVRSPLPLPVPFPNAPDAGQPDESTGQPIPPGTTPADGSIPADGSGDMAANPPPGSGAPGIDSPTSGSDTDSGDELGEVVIGRSPTPTNLTLSVVNVRHLSPQETADIPEQNAELLTSSISVVADPTQAGACPLFPEGVSDFGAPVTLRLTVEADGRVSNAELQSPASGNYVYTELVQCLARTGLQFRPAQDSGIPRPSDNTLVEVTVVGE